MIILLLFSYDVQPPGLMIRYPVVGKSCRGQAMTGTIAIRIRSESAGRQFDIQLQYPAAVSGGAIIDPLFRDMVGSLVLSGD